PIFFRDDGEQPNNERHPEKTNHQFFRKTAVKHGEQSLPPDGFCHGALWNDDVWHKNKCIERQDEDGTDKSDADSKPYPIFLKSWDFFFMEPCLDDRRAESGSPHASFSNQDEDK